MKILHAEDGKEVTLEDLFTKRCVYFGWVLIAFIIAILTK